MTATVMYLVEVECADEVDEEVERRSFVSYLSVMIRRYANGESKPGGWRVKSVMHFAPVEDFE